MLSLQTKMGLAPRPGLEPGTCGLTPISRRGVKTANESLVVLATILSMVPRCIARHALVSSLYWLRTESRQTPIRFKHYADRAHALVAQPPQKNVGTTSRPRICLQFGGCQPLGTSLELARDAGDPDSIHRGAEAVSIQSAGSRPVNPLARCCCTDPRSGETTLHVERLVLLEHVIASARQLVRECLGGHHAVGPRLLAFIEVLRFDTIAAGKVRCFHERPGQVGITVLDVALPLLLAIGHACTVHTPRIGGKVAHCSKALNRAHLQHDQRRQRLPDPGNAGEQAKFGPQSHALVQSLLELVNLSVKRLDD